MSPFKCASFSISGAILVLALLSGCSRGLDTTVPNSNPTIPTSAAIPIVGVSDWNPDGSPLAGMGTIGLFNVNIDPLNLTGELTPLRQNSLTDVLEVVDITNFLTLAPCTKCVKIKSVALDIYGNIVVSVGIKHPFPAGDPAKPITGRNRADLHIFNIEGIIVSNAASISFPGINSSVAGFNLLNADGYTGYLDDSLDDIYPTEATVHPYILHFDDYSAGNFDVSNPCGFASVTDPAPSGNLVMAQGTDYNFQDYVFDVDSDFNFLYAVGCTYAISAATKSDRFTPDYRIPQHNKKAASEISISIISNTLRDGDTSSTASIEVHVVDVSHGIPAGTERNQMLSESNVNDIFIEVPGITTAPIFVDGNSPSGGTGHSPSDPLVYPATITNLAAGAEGIYRGLVKVTDTYAPGQNGAPTLNGMDGIKRVDPLVTPLAGLFSISEFATYQAFIIEISQSCGPITGSITSPTCPITGVIDDSYINFSASASSANGGDPVVLYEWCMDYDGTPAHFTIDATGQNVQLGPFDNPTCGTPNEQPVTYTVAVRATDSCPNPNHTIFETCSVTVDQCRDIFKNIPLPQRAFDLAVDPTDGRVMIIYLDGKIFQYQKDNNYQLPIPNATYYDSNWFSTVIYNQSRLPTTYSCVPDKAFLAFSDNQKFILGYGMYINDWVDRAWYRPIDGTNPLSGTQISHIVPRGNWAVSYTIFEVIAWPSDAGDLANDMGDIWGCAVPDYAYFSHSSPTNNYATEFYAYKGVSGNKLGTTIFWPTFCTGAEIDGVNGRSIWAVEHTDCYVARWSIVDGTGATFSYDNAYCGTGIPTVDDTGVYAPKDLTRTSDNKILVLDKVSATSDTFEVKSWNVTSSPGVPAGTLDISGLNGPILRIDCGDYNHPTYGNMLFVLHGNTTLGYFMSIYRKSELPW